MYLGKEFSVFLRFFEVVACTYAVLRNTPKCSSALENVTLMILATLTTILLYISILPLIIYKVLIAFILEIKYQENFGGLLEGPDVIWTDNDKGSNNIVTYLLIIEFDKSSAEFLAYVREVCAKKFLRSTRLTCVRRNFMGYNFLVKNQLAVDDVVRELPAGQTLGETIQEHCNKPLPKNNTAAWELLVGTQPIDLDQFPLLVRIHHAVADGMTFLSLLVKEISDEGVSVPNVPKTRRDGIKDLGRLHSRLILFLNPADGNVLRNANLSGRKRVGFYVEHERRYIKVIKRIKGRVEGATFSSVILTAISASLGDYFKKKARPPPEDVTLSFIAIADRNELNFDHPELANIFSMASMKLPVAFAPSETLSQRFLKVQRAYSQVTRSHDIWINHCLLHVLCDLLPTPLLRTFLRMSDVPTIGFSNLPGFQKIHIGGYALRNLLFWIPNYLSLGVGFSLVTYDDKFQMGLMVDEVIIREEDGAQEILDGVFKQVDLLDKEFV